MQCDYDLHVHSTYSDGTVDPPSLLEKAMVLGLSGISITDHDSLDGIEPAITYIKSHKCKIDYVPGVELNTEAEGGNEVHILGYYIDHNNSVFRQRLEEIRTQRRERARQITEKLISQGYKISFARVTALAGSDLIGRPHIAMAMVEAGYAQNIRQVFDQHIGYGQPAYVKRYKFFPQEALELIKSSGGVAVLAHPGLIKSQLLIEGLIKDGIEGLEVYYPQHSPHQIAAYLSLAKAKQLLITGGSDYHGPESSESRARLGAAGIDRETMLKLKVYKNKLT